MPKEHKPKKPKEPPKPKTIWTPTHLRFFHLLDEVMQATATTLAPGEQVSVQIDVLRALYSLVLEFVPDAPPPEPLDKPKKSRGKSA